MDFEDKIIETDILDKLYQLFEDIEENVIQGKDNLSYKKINDEINVFIMIDRETLQNLLEEYKHLIEKNLKRNYNHKNKIGFQSCIPL
jgi:hypothetical protein